MSNLSIKSQRLATTAVFEDTTRELAITTNYEQDPSNDNIIIMLNGSVNDTTDAKTYLGTFNSSLVNGNLQFNFSGIIDLSKLSAIADSVLELKATIEGKK